MFSNWVNPDYDTALVLTQVTGNSSSIYAQHVRDFVREYVNANGQVKCVFADPISSILSPLVLN
jgi:hypothetical protein